MRHPLSAVLLVALVATPGLATDQDPYLWLEEVESEKALACAGGREQGLSQHPGESQPGRPIEQEDGHLKPTASDPCCCHRVPASLGPFSVVRPQGRTAEGDSA